uniref:Uncharacterized protein n=1 Tax=Glossina pallidipes TaxID=7398 RepID=A0A1B0AD81_GLOPL
MTDDSNNNNNVNNDANQFGNNDVEMAESDVALGNIGFVQTSGDEERFRFFLPVVIVSQVNVGKLVFTWTIENFSVWCNRTSEARGLLISLIFSSTIDGKSKL